MYKYTISTNSHPHQLFQIPIKDIEVHTTFYPIKSSTIGMLPELPISFVLQVFNIIVGNPIRISGKGRLIEVFIPKLIGGIDDRSNPIMPFNDGKPLSCTLLKLLGTFLAHDFDIKNRRKISGLERHVSDKILCLHICRHIGQKEMISSTHYTTLASCSKIVLKTIVDKIASLRSLHKGKIQGTFAKSCPTETRPIDFSLMMGDVYTVDVRADKIEVLHLFPHQVGTKEKEIHDKQVYHTYQ